MLVAPQTSAWQGSHLYVVLSGGCLSCRLIAADYDGGKSFSEYIAIPLPKHFSLYQLDALLSELLIAWSDEINWQIVDCNSGFCLPMSANHTGVGGAKLLVSKEYFVEDFHSDLLSTDAVLYDDQLEVSTLPYLMNAVSVTDAIFVNLGWHEISVLLASSAKSAPLLEKGTVQVNEFRLRVDSPDDLLKTNMTSLMSVNVHKEDLGDLLANLFENQITESISPVVWDILRAYVTASLFKIQDKVFRKFGNVAEQSHVFVTGDLAAILPSRYTFLSIIDGLQLKGRFGVSIDRDYKYLVASKALKREEGFICPINEIYQGGYLYISPEKGANGRVGRLAYTGKIAPRPVVSEKPNLGAENVSFPEISVLGQADELHTYDLDNSGTIHLKPEKSVYFPNMKQDKGYFVTDYSSSDKHLVIDMRKIPVVYGPDVHANLRRISDWLRNINLDKSL